MNDIEYIDSNWLPDELIQAQRNGELLLFCGAGVSMNAGLPSFKDLVEEIIQRSASDDISKELIENGAYDKVIFYLESREPKFKRLAREEITGLIKEIFKKKTEDSQDVLERHKIILQLACSNKKLRLVTTNFDDLFEKAIEELDIPKDDIQIYKAPLIPPTAAPNRWSGIIKIHGSLELKNKGNTEELILSSADVARAYMKEGWASRFVIDMFKHFNVLFIGYSMNDPLMAYLMDSYAVDAQTEELKQAYILLPESEDKKFPNIGIKRINYKKGEDHKDLDIKLNHWLKNYTMGGVKLKQEIKNLKDNISSDTKRKNLIKHLTTNKDAIKFFVREKIQNDIAGIEWLPYLDKEIVTPLLSANQKDDENSFSKWLDTDKDAARNDLSYWLAQHIDKYQVIDWLLEQSGNLLPLLFDQILRIDHQKIQQNKYQAIINILLTNCSVSRFRTNECEEVLSIKKQIINCTLISIDLKLRIIEFLKPRLEFTGRSLSEAIENIIEEEITIETIEKCYKDIFKISLPEEYTVEKLDETINKLASADMAVDFMDLLKQYFDLEHLINKYRNKDTANYYVILDKENMHYRRLSLIDIVISSLDALFNLDHNKAKILVQNMFNDGIVVDEKNYPILTRIALYSLTSSNCKLSADEKFALVWHSNPKILIEEKDCKEEASLFLKKIWTELSLEKQNNFWDEIRKNINNESKKHNICRRITWVKETKGDVPEDIEKWFISSDYKPNNYDNIYPKSVYYGESFQKTINYEDFIKYNIKEHIEQLTKAENKVDDFEFTRYNNINELWREWGEKDSNAALSKLSEITKTKFFDITWRELMQGFCMNTERKAQEFEVLFETLNFLPDKHLKSIIPTYYVLSNLCNVKDFSNFNEELFIKIFNRLLSFACRSKPIKKENLKRMWHEDVLSDHLGSITYTLVKFMLAKSDGYRVENTSLFEYLFDKVISEEVNDKFYAQAILLGNLYIMSVFLPEWTEKNIIPLLNWENPNKEYTKQYWYAYLLVFADLRRNEFLVERIKQYVLTALSVKNFNTQAREKLVHLVTLLWRDKTIQLKEFTKNFTPKDRISALLLLQYRISKILDKEARAKEYEALKEFFDLLVTKNNPACEDLSEIIIQTLLDTPLHYWKNDWFDFWRNKVGYPKDLWNIKNYIIGLDEEALKEEYQLLLSVLFTIINRELGLNIKHSICQDLQEILKNIEEVIPKEQLIKNDDYNSLCDIVLSTVHN